MYRIFDTEFRCVVRADFETHEEAERCLAELIQADSRAEGALRILVSGQGPSRKAQRPRDTTGPRGEMTPGRLPAVPPA